MAKSASVAPARPPVRRGHPNRAFRVTVLVIAVLAAAVGVYFAGPYAARAFGGPPPVWHAGSSPAPPTPVLPAANTSAPVPAASGVSATLTPLINATGLGGHVSLSVVDTATGRSLFAVGPDTATVPASTTKIVTAATVLATRGATYRLATRAVAGAQPGEVVLVGGGDPTLSAGPNGPYPEAARLDQLAAKVRESLGNASPTRVVYDASLFTGAKVGPGWDSDSVSGGYVAPVTALMIDGGRTNPHQSKTPAARSTAPERSAARAFAKALGLPASAVAAGKAAPGARELGSVTSPPLVRLVDIMLNESDNVLAEALARQVAIGRGQPATFAGAAEAMRAALGDLGVPAAGYGLVDGSGLSRTGRLTPALLTGVLTVAARDDRAELHGLFSGLPVAGYSGTLRERYRSASTGSAAAGSVRAKTGTLTGVSAIAGIAIDVDGRTLSFAVLADAVSKGTGAAQEALDRIAAAIAGCGCR